MRRRPLFLPCAVLLLAGLAALPACKKKATDTGSGSDNPAPGPTGTPSAAGSSDYVLYAHIRAKEIRESSLFAEVKEAVDKAGAAADWDKFEADAIKDLGVKPTDIDSVTVFVTDVPKNKEPKLVAIMAANKAIDKASVLKKQGGAQAKADKRGFYEAKSEGGLIHFPDAKTLVLVHPDLAQQYLDGYASSRTGWPMNADLTRAATGHTIYAVANVDKLPTQELARNIPLPQIKPLLSAKKVTLTADLKEKAVNVAVRASFPGADAAGKAQGSVKELIGMANSLIDVFANGKDGKELAIFMPAIQEGKRALNDAKVEVSGSDLLVSGSYQADFDIGTMVVEAVKKTRKATGSLKAQNNLKQIGLALHNCADVYGGSLPIHAITTKGQPLRNATDKPLLSWRVAILPFIEQDNLYRQFKLDEPWDSPNNKKLIEQMPQIFAPVDQEGKPGYTHLQMVIGPNALSAVNTRMPASFTDGTSNTIAVVEAAQPVIWTKPDDVMLPGKVLPKDFRKKFGGLQPGGFNVLMWDATTRFVRDSVSDQVLSLLLNPNDGQAILVDWWK